MTTGEAIIVNSFKFVELNFCACIGTRDPRVERQGVMIQGEGGRGEKKISDGGRKCKEALLVFVY